MAEPTPDRQLLAVAGTLPPPFVLLEDGLGAGTRTLAWDPAERLRIPWTAEAVGTLEQFAPPGEWCGAVAYDFGLPPRAPRRRPMIPQPLVDCFRPRQRIVLRGDRVECVGAEAEARWQSWEAGTRKRRNAGKSAPEEAAAGVMAPLAQSFEAPAYEAVVRRALEHIRAGDIYQANLSVARRVALHDAPFAVYRRLRAINPSPWMGYADFGDWQLVCGSPELLVEVRGDCALARPIAGTRKKTGEAAVDDAMRRELRSDAKESAEHVMLVDLARNDLGRMARFGGVRVAELGRIEEYSHVMHLVSDVEARLRPGTTPLDVFRATFPGGTITGTPKIRAMEIIAELEPVARGMYTGALGWWGDEAGQWNIVIRSAVVRGGEAVVQAGAGIVADSDPAREWKESLRKAAAVMEAVGGPASGSAGR